MELRRMIDRGENPMTDQAAPSNAPTMHDLIAKFERDESARLRPATRRTYRSLIKSAILPTLGDMPVGTVTVADVERLHRGISVRAPYAANRAVMLLSRLFRLAVKWGWREGNPESGISKNLEPPRHRYLNVAELDRFLAALDNLGDR
jgi:Phage integrase, N-terminal SAM-like domain